MNSALGEFTESPGAQTDPKKWSFSVQLRLACFGGDNSMGPSNELVLWVQQLMLELEAQNVHVTHRGINN